MYVCGFVCWWVFKCVFGLRFAYSMMHLFLIVDQTLCVFLCLALHNQ
jgi:hypothetical protein